LLRKIHKKKEARREKAVKSKVYANVWICKIPQFRARKQGANVNTVLAERVVGQKKYTKGGVKTHMAPTAVSGARSRASVLFN